MSYLFWVYRCGGYKIACYLSIARKGSSRANIERSVYVLTRVQWVLLFGVHLYKGPVNALGLSFVARGHMINQGMVLLTKASMSYIMTFQRGNNSRP